jgi:hypothetical protein
MVGHGLFSPEASGTNAFSLGPLLPRPGFCFPKFLMINKDKICERVGGREVTKKRKELTHLGEQQLLMFSFGK